MALLKEKFGRNLNIEQEYQAEYNKLKEKGSIFEEFDNADIFMMALALGYNASRPKKMKKKYPEVNLNGFEDRDIWIMTAIAVKDHGLSILSEITEIKNIAEQYANGGFEILLKRINSGDSGDVLKHIEEEILDSLKKIKEKF